LLNKGQKNEESDARDVIRVNAAGIKNVFIMSDLYYFLVMKTCNRHSKKEGLASWDNGFKFAPKYLKSLNDKWFEKRVSYTFGIYFL
jgi:hypothetical protein